MPKMFHLSWFTNFTVDEWNDPFSAGGGMPWNGRYYVEMVQALERACFNYLMLEDALMLVRRLWPQHRDGGSRVPDRMQL